MIARLATIIQHTRARHFPTRGGDLDLFDDRNAQVYGDSEVDPNTLPFNPDDLCIEHSPACCLRSRVLHCAECGEVLSAN